MTLINSKTHTSWAHTVMYQLWKVLKGQSQAFRVCRAASRSPSRVPSQWQRPPCVAWASWASRGLHSSAFRTLLKLTVNRWMWTKACHFKQFLKCFSRIRKVGPTAAAGTSSLNSWQNCIGYIVSTLYLLNKIFIEHSKKTFTYHELKQKHIHVIF